MKSASFAHAAFGCPPAIASRAASNLLIRPCFCDPLSEELLTLVFRFSIVADAVSTVTVKLQLVLLPEVSVAVQVTVVVPIGKVEPEAGLQTKPTPGQLSETTGAKVALAPAGQVGSFTMLPGQVMAGGSVSLTVTVNWQLPVLPCASVAEHVTVVVPLANVEPDAGEQLTAPTPGQLSVAVGVV
jgi:hypothetical protein